jgi:DNA-binding IclR family transcriptional regulator
MAPKTGKCTHKYEVQNIHFVLDILQFLSVSRTGKSLATFVEKMPETSKNKVFRILHTLETHAFISKSNDGEYLLGPWAYKMARSILTNNHDISMMRSVQEQLAAKTQEAVYLGIVKDDEALLTELVECKKVVRAVNCIGESFRITAGTLIGSTPACKIYVGKDTLMEDVTTVSALFTSSNGVSPVALVLVAPSCRISEVRIANDLHAILSAYELNLSALYGLDRSSQPASSAKQSVQNRVGV